MKKSDLVKPILVAKGKKRRTEILDDAEAMKKLDAAILTPRKAQDAKAVHHKDEVNTKEIKEIVGDEIEAIGEEIGIQINRLNATEYYAHNLILALRVKSAISFREKTVPMAKCAEHK